MYAQWWLSLMMLSGLLSGLPGFHAKAAHPDLSSPKAAVRSFADGLARKDFKFMAECVQDASGLAELERMFAKSLKMADIWIGIETGDLMEEDDADKARVAVEIAYKIPTSDKPGDPKMTANIVDMLTLQKQQEVWHILPDVKMQQAFRQFDASHSKQLPGMEQVAFRPLSVFATLLGGGKSVLSAIDFQRETAYATSCIMNEKQAVLGILMSIEDHDEKFPSKGTNYIDRAMPYIAPKGGKPPVFTCPLDARGTISYAYNTNLAGLSVAAVKSPSKTVLLYEGKNMQLNFRHKGKAAVAFVDGHVKMIAPNEAGSLLWHANSK